MRRLYIVLVSMLFISFFLLFVNGIITILKTIKNDKPVMDMRMQQMLETLENNDKYALKAMFSKKAIDEADDIDGGIDYLFDFFQGNVESCKSGGFGFESGYRNGGKIVLSKSRYTVTTDDDTYLFFILDYTEYETNPDNKGFYTLHVIKKADETWFEYDWDNLEIAGIYRP